MLQRPNRAIGRSLEARSDRRNRKMGKQISESFWPEGATPERFLSRLEGAEPSRSFL
jgi:hypothetical protein